VVEERRSTTVPVIPLAESVPVPVPVPASRTRSRSRL
jgi:hypothetical protein